MARVKSQRQHLPDDAEEELRSLLRPKGTPFGAARIRLGFPPDRPTHAPPFRPDPLVIGTELGRQVEKFLKLAPELRGNVTEVRSGPTRAMMALLDQEGIPIDRFLESSLAGGFNPGERDIYVSPFSDAGVLAHELTHAAGLPHGHGPERAEELARLLPERTAVKRRKVP